MGLLLRTVVLVFCFQLAHFTDPPAAPCVMELECAECVPDNMPLVTSHRAANGSLQVAAGDELTLACGGGKFLAFPLRDTLTVRCEAGRYRLPGGQLRHLLDLGCQESIFEDVLHQVDNCGGLQGRAYLMRRVGAAPRHLAALCFDADRALAARLRMRAAPHDALAPGAAHSDRAPPLSLLGNFNHMFDASTRHAAERLYGDDARMNRRLHELLKHERYSFAEQSLTSAKLLSSHYFEDQNMRATDFVSNRAAVWRSVARGNLRHLQRDVAALLARSRPHAALTVHAGTHGVLSLRTGHERTEIFLKAGNRFPVPKYIWTVVHAEQANKAVALVLLNDPFVSVSEIRDAVFCESACGRVSWLHELRRQRRYERPLYGLVFCCSVGNFSSVVPELPAQLVDVPPGNAGMLTDLFF